MIRERFSDGTYYIGDLSYIVKGEEGYQWIEQVWDYFYNDHKGKITIDGIELFLHSSYEGDGVFNGFFVDSGCLSIIKIDTLLDDSRFNFKNFNIRGVRFVKFDHEFEITYDQGLFTVGEEININTKLS